MTLDEIEVHLETLEAERDEATAKAEGEIAGMREVALFRAANAQGCIGNLARPLLAEARRLQTENEKLRRVYYASVPPL